MVSSSLTSDFAFFFFLPLYRLMSQVFFFLIFVDVSFESDVDDSKDKAIAEKIMGLPVGDRLWPNCLNRVIKNASPC